MSDFVTVRKFNKLGLSEVRKILESIRNDGVSRENEIKSLLQNRSFTNAVPGSITIDLERQFETKLDMISYLNSVLPKDFLEEYRRDNGLWTWFAAAYYMQLIKKSKRTKTDTGAIYCWVYDHKQFIASRRHFIAGPMYLYQDFSQAQIDTLDLFFSAPINEFGGFIDAVSYKEEFARIPAMLQVASWLYYDPQAANKVKRGAAAQQKIDGKTYSKPGTIRELTRMSDHFAMTYDIFNVEDAGKFWNLLPPQFDRFKGNAEH